MHLVVAYLKYRPSKFDDSAIMHNFNALPPGNLSSNLNFVFLDDTTLVHVPIFGGCQGRRTGVGVTTVFNSLILGRWVTKVLKNDDEK